MLSGWRAIVDPRDEVPEVCEENNSVAVGEPRPRFTYLAATGANEESPLP